MTSFLSSTYNALSFLFLWTLEMRRYIDFPAVLLSQAMSFLYLFCCCEEKVKNGLGVCEQL